jgi:DNA-binding transcriptional LysR family regulator
MIGGVLSSVQWIALNIDIDVMNLRSFDINLLTVFDAISAEGNQSRAAQRLGMSQPAMSNALARLRATLNDPLFVRTPNGMTPTPCARDLVGPVRQALDLIQAGVERAKRGEKFDYAASTRTIVMMVEGYGDTVIMPRFLDWLMRTAPGVRIRARHEMANTGLSNKLNDGSVDIAIQYTRPQAGELRAKHLLDDEFVSMVRADHPTVGDTLSLAQFLALPHVVYGRLGSRGLRNSAIDRDLMRQGLTRNIALQVPGFHSMPIIVQNTTCICTLPRRMAHAYAGGFRLKILKPPMQLAPLSLYLIWGGSMDRDPAHQWLRNSIQEICQRF